jgi:hypothetical protein
VADSDSDRDARAAELAAVAAAEAARAAKDAAREASLTLANLQVQGAARLDVMDELAEALLEARTAMAEFLAGVDSMATVEDVRVSAAAMRVEQAGRRHLTVLRVCAAVVWLTIAVGWGVNQQVEHCSPGRKAYRVTSLLTNPRESLTVDALQKEARRPAPTWCDVSLPTTAHSPLDSWPTMANVVGFGLYAVALVATGVIVRRRRWEHEPPPPVGAVASRA